MTPRRAARAPARRMRERGSRYTSAISEPIVVDASIAFLWFANEADRSGADELLEGDSTLLAPDLMAVEAANAWWKKLRRHEMERADVEQAITNLLALGIAWTPSAMLLPSAARLAVDLGHPVYDCLYLALAVSHAAPIATADKRLQQAAGRIGVRVKN
ncbi:MAG TPA: type II toxin-antitoxin system VapC family toxin [Methylomirabilota bacterium]|nr:type II toxin-antitoxin system VapC family toxin [Methylomirabilota bacterium]